MDLLQGTTHIITQHLYIQYVRYNESPQQIFVPDEECIALVDNLTTKDFETHLIHCSKFWGVHAQAPWIVRPRQGVPLRHVTERQQREGPAYERKGSERSDWVNGTRQVETGRE